MERASYELKEDLEKTKEEDGEMSFWPDGFKKLKTEKSGFKSRGRPFFNEDELAAVKQEDLKKGWKKVESSLEASRYNWGP